MLPHASHGKNTYWKEGVLFLLRMGGIALLLYIFFSRFEYTLQSIEAGHVRGILERVGIETQNGFSPIQFWVKDKLIEISALCSGLIEFVLLSGAILATKTVSLKKRMKGMIIGIVLLYFFNLLRIAITVLQLAHTPLEFASLTHDVLFRLALILGFAFIYAAWINFSLVRKKMTQKEWG